MEEHEVYVPKDRLKQIAERLAKRAERETKEVGPNTMATNLAHRAFKYAQAGE